MAASFPDPSLLLAATGCATIGEAVSWIAEDHPLDQQIDSHELLRALVGYGRGLDYQEALRRLARIVAASDLDSAAVIFQPELIAAPERFRTTLKALAARCPSSSIAKITSSAVLSAQREEPFTMEALCAVAGLSYSELRQRVPDLPTEPGGRWAPSQIRRAFELIDALVKGAVSTELPGAIPARALENIASLGAGVGGWESVERRLEAGVPYEVLLAQRANGGAWLAHRNRTSSQLTPLLADRLCNALEARGLSYLRSTSIGGDVPPRQISEQSGCDKQIALLVKSSGGRICFGVIFSSARDSGTASKSASRLRSMQRASGLPVAVLVAGPGWAMRNETAELAAEFEGRLFSERDADSLADAIAIVAHDEEGNG